MFFIRLMNVFLDNLFLTFTLELSAFPIKIQHHVYAHDKALCPHNLSDTLNSVFRIASFQEAMHTLDENDDLSCCNLGSSHAKSRTCY